MKNIILIAKREFLTQVRKKSFIILTLLAPLLIVGFGALIALMFKANESTHSFNVIDKSGLFQNKLKSDENLKYIYLPEANEASMKAALRDMQGIDGLLIIPKLENNDFRKLEEETKLLVNKKIGFGTKNDISIDLEKVIRSEKITALGLNETQIKDIDKGFTLKAENVVDEKTEDNDMVFSVKYGLSMVLMYVVFMFIIIYGVRVMRSVLEEKNNRVVEIIISSVKPFELMMGKIIGVTMVALTQFIIWITMSVVAALFLNTGFAAMNENLPVGGEEAAVVTKAFDPQNLAAEVSHTLLEMNFPLIIFVFIVFFLLGYIFYSAMYAAIGSAVDNETETQQFTLFAILPLMIGMYGSITVTNNPEGPMAFWLSIIPFTSPVAMIARIPFGVPAWQIVLSTALLIGATFLMVFIASKVYKVGILMYGNKATLKELWKWIKN
ncbi:ABC transporter permease [Chryseobacterium taklimakanense]|uniref:ABC transporter permease n=1 Tax=Chryseobacterium taklimakanense TaxID=536441 RepID=A0A3G8WFC6_9FLAO|nr:ABC transporter permease [Chryseobacterium taklimakanense]AZI19850.1 ABC transporter permease [Chryseobacterium taklimakanense]